jgi:electron transport complex protein RnfB
VSARAPLHSLELVERLDRILPQTQCGQCGFEGCRPYAQAMADGKAGIDRCPPGGDAGARALAKLLGVEAEPYDRGRGAHKPPLVALIVEADCIGCTKCIQACPVDAIVGASKLMHVVVEPLCTGCELCVPACPVDCIVMEAAAAGG